MHIECSWKILFKLFKIPSLKLKIHVQNLVYS